MHKQKLHVQGSLHRKPAPLINFLLSSKHFSFSLKIVKATLLLFLRRIAYADTITFRFKHSIQFDVQQISQ